MELQQIVLPHWLSLFIYRSLHLLPLMSSMQEFINQTAFLENIDRQRFWVGILLDYSGGGGGGGEKGGQRWGRAKFGKLQVDTGKEDF